LKYGNRSLIFCAVSPVLRTPRVACIGLFVLTFAVLAPFSTKAVHIDDPLYLWGAQCLLSGKPAALAVMKNWTGVTQPLVTINKNPPGASWVMMPIIAAAGASEVALHLEMALIAAAAITGVYALAQQLCDRPAIAALLVLVSPGFFISATTLMCDVLMFCLWTWSIVAWLWAQRNLSGWRYLLSGILIAAAALSKYPAIALLPLLAVAGTQKRQWIWQAAGLLIPIAALVVLQISTIHEYHYGLFSGAVEYVSQQSRIATFFADFVNGLCYLGGCFPAAMIVWAIGWNRRQALYVVAASIVMIGLILLGGSRVIQLESFAEENRTLITWHVVILAPLGMWALWMAGHGLCIRRDRTTMLLALWVFGVFTFASVVNWTTNARSLLPMAPALAILAMRQIQRTDIRFTRQWIALPIGLSTVLAIVLAISDEQIANASRDAANLIHARARTFHGTMWFTGHWGFQWYMENDGAAEVDNDASVLKAGDLFVLPQYNTRTISMPDAAISPVDQFDRPVMSWISTANIPCGALFYSSAAGPLPWVIGPMEPERFTVYRVTQNILPPKN
jgi:hypothetical protein